jgi:hypothetical protein
VSASTKDSLISHLINGWPSAQIQEIKIKPYVDFTQAKTHKRNPISTDQQQRIDRPDQK